MPFVFGRLFLCTGNSRSCHSAMVSGHSTNELRSSRQQAQTRLRSSEMMSRHNLTLAIIFQTNMPYRFSTQWWRRFQAVVAASDGSATELSDAGTRHPSHWQRSAPLHLGPQPRVPARHDDHRSHVALELQNVLSVFIHVYLACLKLSAFVRTLPVFQTVCQIIPDTESAPAIACPSCDSSQSSGSGCFFRSV